MSERRVMRALERLSAAGAVLARERVGAGYGVFANGDRRRRPSARISETELRELAASGVLVATEDGYALSAAGRARLRREKAAPEEAYAAQHQPIIDRVVMDGDGRARALRGHDADQTLRRLAALHDGAGRTWLSAGELAAATRLRADWLRGEIGLVRGSDWSAPPKGDTARGPASDAMLAARCDARRRVADALARLAPPLRVVVEHVCLREEGLEALERAEAWPARSGKLALKLALAQLASA